MEKRDNSRIQDLRKRNAKAMAKLSGKEGAQVKEPKRVTGDDKNTKKETTKK